MICLPQVLLLARMSLPYCKSTLLRPCPTSSNHQYSPTTPLEPVLPAHFFGREDYLHSMIETIRVKTKMSIGARLIVRGSGGIGKTAVAITVYHDPVIQNIFKSHRHFVRCDGSDTAALLLAAIASSLGVDLSKGKPLNLILDTLKGSRDPLLLVLDNFETAWHSEHVVDQEEISTILLQISTVQHLSLIVTIRSIEKPHGVK